MGQVVEWVQFGPARQGPLEMVYADAPGPYGQAHYSDVAGRATLCGKPVLCTLVADYSCVRVWVPGDCYVCNALASLGKR